MSVFNGFFDNLIGGATNPKGNLGDFRHAARLYVDNNMRLAPKVKFLYHVVFNINAEARRLSPLLNEIDRNEINLLCYSADLPRYNLQTETLNQYNRKKIVQTGVQYQPVTITFHDDNAGLTSLFWEAYFRYYYADSNYTERNADNSPVTSVRQYEKGPGGINSMYANERFINNRYGLDKPNKPQNFFTSIQIFQLHPQNGQSTYTSFTLVNPKIDQYQHDQMAQDLSEFTKNTMSISYEAVFYNRGYTAIGNAPAGFAETHYDKTPSPITLGGGGTASLFGSAGVIAGAANALRDFQSGNIAGGIVNAARTIQNSRNLNRNAEINRLIRDAEASIANRILGN